MDDTISPEWREHFERRERELEARIATLTRALEPFADIRLVHAPIAGKSRAVSNEDVARARAALGLQ